MDKETETTAKELLAIVADSKKFTEARDFHSLFLEAEAIISSLAYLIGPKLNAEQAYRIKLRDYMNEGDSHAKAESKAKADEEYKNWKKLEAVYELGDAQIMILKKFANDLGNEYKRTV